MNLLLSLSAPEHAHLIVNYHEVFYEHNTFKIAWDCPTVPRTGEYFDFPFIAGLVSEQVDITFLPKVWQVMDVKWQKETTGIVPVLSVVGK